MAANVATGKGAADMVEVVDEGGATVAPTGGELSLWPGVEEHAASATTSATTMTLPVLVIMPPFFLVVRFIGRSCVPSAGVELDRLDDRCGLFDELLEALFGRHHRARPRLNRHALREVDEVQTSAQPRARSQRVDPAADRNHSGHAMRAAV